MTVADVKTAYERVREVDEAEGAAGLIRLGVAAVGHLTLKYGQHAADELLAKLTSQATMMDRAEPHLPN